MLATALAMNAQTQSVFASFSPAAQYTDGMHLYQFVSSNPITRGDPSGQLFGGLVEAFGSITMSAYMRGTAFAAAHPLLIKVAGTIMAAIDLYGFIQYEEVQAVLAANPNAIGFFQAQAAVARGALGQVLKGRAYLKWLAKNAPTAAAKVRTTVQGVKVAIRGIMASRKIRFAQAGISRTFSNHPKFKGMKLTDVADMLRRGSAKADDFPIEVVNLDGVTYTVNNRSLYTLRLASKEPTIVKDVSDVAESVKDIRDRLAEMAKLGLADTDGFVPVVRGGP